MKIGFHRPFCAIFVVAALLVPAAAAKPGNGNSHDHGPPAWAGGGSGGAKAHGKPASAGKGQEKAEKAAQREARRAARAAASEAPADAPKHDNPAWVCKFEREQIGDEAFTIRYGTNDTKANAFGKCVSTEAHDRDGSAAADGEAPAAAEPDVGEPADQPVVGDDESVAADALAALRAFFNALTGLVL